VDATWPGSVHDSRIFKNSSIYPIMQGIGNNAFLLGDQGYSIAPFLMTPYENILTPLERRFNMSHCRNRILIEHAFGQLKSRFPFLKACIRVKTERIPSYICACFILHNIAKSIHDPDFAEEYFDEEEDIIPYEGPQHDLQIRIQGKHRRDAIALQLND
jgi:hypothetical protein